MDLQPEPRHGIEPENEQAKGAAILEMSLLVVLLLLLVGAAIDCGVAYFGYQTVQNAAREGARLAAALPNLEQNDQRVQNEVQSRIDSAQLISAVSSLTVENSSPVSKLGIVNALNLPCDQEFTVAVTANIDFLFLRIVGFPGIPVKRRITMRYQIQPICT